MKILGILAGVVFAAVMLSVLMLVMGVNFQSPSTAQGAALYNSADEVSVQGIVQSVEDFDCPVSEGEVSGHLNLKTSGGVLQVHLAPVRILRSQKISFMPGDSIGVVGSKIRLAGTKGIIAREITRNTETIIFRDQSGQLIMTQ